jgi:hypothetical protein
VGREFFMLSSSDPATDACFSSNRIWLVLRVPRSKIESRVLQGLRHSAHVRLYEVDAR